MHRTPRTLRLTLGYADPQYRRVAAALIQYGKQRTYGLMQIQYGH